MFIQVEPTPKIGKENMSKHYIPGVEEIGLIDENFFIDGEETEFSLRAWSKGYISVINNNLTIYHKVAATNKVGSSFSLYLKIRNGYYSLNKNRKIIQDYKYFSAIF